MVDEGVIALVIKVSMFLHELSEHACHVHKHKTKKKANKLILSQDPQGFLPKGTRQSLVEGENVVRSRKRNELPPPNLSERRPWLQGQLIANQGQEGPARFA